MTREAVGILLVALLLDAIVIHVAPMRPVSDVSCPTFCVCDAWYDLQRISCTGRHLYSIHTGAPSGVQALDVSNNSISALSDHELTDAGLSELKYLNLSANAISEIGLNAFDGLFELTVLDLSRNHLYYLLSDIFVPTRNLRILRLSRNNFNSHIPRLECPWLTDLSLDSCQISYMPMDTFTGLSRLRTLDLSNNVLIQLDSVTLQVLPSLRKLSLEGNPWSCNKLMYDLQIYLMYKNIEYRAVCAKTPGPRKFEKMVVYNPETKHRPPVTSNVNVKKSVIIRKKNLTAATSTYNDTIARANATEDANFAKTLNAISPYWFFTIGFLLGSACSMFTCYMWLTKAVASCCRERGERRTGDIQRVSLLQDQWQFEDSTFNESTQARCPDTPPPPYREVMMRPGLYREREREIR